jgi:hypothetical protein
MNFLGISGSGEADAAGRAFITTNPSNPANNECWLLQYVQIASVPARSGMFSIITVGQNGTPLAPPGSGAAVGWSQILLTGGQMVFEVEGLQPGDLIEVSGNGVSGSVDEIIAYTAGSPLTVFTLPAPAGTGPVTPPTPNAFNHLRLTNTLAVENLIEVNPGVQVFLWTVMLVPVSNPTSGAQMNDVATGDLLIFGPASLNVPISLSYGGLLLDSVSTVSAGPTAVVQIHNLGDVNTVWDFYAIWAEQ